MIFRPQSKGGDSPLRKARPVCPDCGAAIPSEDVSVERDVMYCRPCHTVYKLSDIFVQEDDRDVDLENPPKGVWYRRAMRGVVMGASHRSLSGALGMLAISLFWNGILSVFIALALSGTLFVLGIPLPEWMQT